ncbi:MAG TPA: preQ(1) synthase [Chitinophagaceae bacterium]|nr:preQ(1) synthase [Chitinophagaceae bacterium]
MKPTSKQDIKEQLKHTYEQALENTANALDYMAGFGIKPEGKLSLFLSPDTRQQDIHKLPYNHEARQVVTYETEPGEFSALCPFSGLPDFGVLRIEYVPGRYILELKSLKYYILSWRNIGAAQEDITAYIYKDLMAMLENPGYLCVTTIYNVRGGINTTCKVDSREQ